MSVSARRQNTEYRIQNTEYRSQESELRTRNKPTANGERRTVNGMDWDQRYQTIFYLKPWDPGEEPDGGPPFGVSTAELDQLFDPVFDRLEEFHPRSSYPGREGREILRLLRKR
jgi:hypothetical protein